MQLEESRLILIEPLAHGYGITLNRCELEMVLEAVETVISRLDLDRLGLEEKIKRRKGKYIQYESRLLRDLEDIENRLLLWRSLLGNIRRQSDKKAVLVRSKLVYHILRLLTLLYSFTGSLDEEAIKLLAGFLYHVGMKLAGYPLLANSTRNSFTRAYDHIYQLKLEVLPNNNSNGDGGDSG